MPDTQSPREFPTEDSLCERCGYPVKGLSPDAACPECGLAVAESSPAKRDLVVSETYQGGLGFISTAWLFLIAPKAGFRRLAVGRQSFFAESYLINIVILAALVYSLMLFTANLMGVLNPTSRVSLDAPGNMAVFVAVCIGIAGMTVVEMIGVTAICKRRGWRVPFPLAQQVCCYASVGWLPGMLIAGAGTVLIEHAWAGQLWFESLIGLVRVRWLIYAGLFVGSLLWFETLVWIGVCQVRFANAWPQANPVPPGRRPL